MKQNIKYELNNEDIINIQFEFCFKCKYFEQCYKYGFPSLMSPECMEGNNES